MRRKPSTPIPGIAFPRAKEYETREKIEKKQRETARKPACVSVNKFGETSSDFVSTYLAIVVQSALDLLKRGVYDIHPASNSVVFPSLQPSAACPPGRSFRAKKNTPRLPRGVWGPKQKVGAGAGGGEGGHGSR